jgi:hypothetical protein
MADIKYPASLVGSGNRAGIGYAEQLFITRKTAETQRFRRQCLIEAIEHLGSARVWFELLDEIGRHHGTAADIDQRLVRYAAIDTGILAAVGGDRFPALPLRAVGGVR